MVAIPIWRPLLPRRPNLFGEKIAFAFAFEQPAPRSDGGELRDDELARLWQWQVLQNWETELEADKGKGVEEEVDNAHDEDSYEEEDGGEGVADVGDGGRALDDGAADAKEGCEGEEGKVLGDQLQLLKERLILKQVLRFADQIKLGADLPNDEDGAEDRADEEGATLDPDVKEEKKLKRGFPAVLLNWNFRWKLLHLWDVDKDADTFDSHDKGSEDDGRVFEKERVWPEAEYENSGSAGEQDGVDEKDDATAAVLGELAGGEVKEKGDAREADKEVAQACRLQVHLFLQLRCDP